MADDLFTQEEVPFQNALNFIMNEETPCDGCSHYQRCARERMACASYARYIQTGFVTKGEDAPTSLHYRRIFERKEREA